jgi:hypothetical protein
MLVKEAWTVLMRSGAQLRAKAEWSLGGGIWLRIYAFRLAAQKVLS